MTKTIKIDSDGFNEVIDIYYRDGVKQDEASAFNYKEEGAENIPRDTFTDADYSSMNYEKAEEYDNQFKARPYMWRHGNKRVLVQCNIGIPQEFWNIEMYNYEKEQRESKWH